jgi:hypothetical protein
MTDPDLGAGDVRRAALCRVCGRRSCATAVQLQQFVGTHHQAADAGLQARVSADWVPGSSQFPKPPPIRELEDQPHNFACIILGELNTMTYGERVITRIIVSIASPSCRKHSILNTVIDITMPTDLVEAGIARFRMDGRDARCPRQVDRREHPARPRSRQNHRPAPASPKAPAQRSAKRIACFLKFPASRENTGNSVRLGL